MVNQWSPSATRRRSAITPAEIYGSSSPLTDHEEYHTSEDGSSGSPSRVNSIVRSFSGTIRSKLDTRHEIRAHLFGDPVAESNELNSVDIPDEEGIHGRKSSTTEVTKSVKGRISRTSTMVSRMSWSQPSYSQSKVVTMTTSTIDEAEDSEQVAKQIKEKAFHDQLAARNHIMSPNDDKPVRESVCSPIRRRSLLTPGIATRTPNDILQRLPTREEAPEDMPDYFSKPNLLAFSPLSRIAALDLADQGRSSPYPRTGTPCEDYPHLGGLKLGSLRVMNGTDPDDDPKQLKRCYTSPNMAKEEDYFTASEGRQSHELERTGRSTTRNGLSGQPSSFDQEKRHGSPLKNECSENTFESHKSRFLIKRKSIGLSKHKRRLSTHSVPPKLHGRSTSLASDHIAEGGATASVGASLEQKTITELARNDTWKSHAGSHTSSSSSSKESCNDNEQRGSIGSTDYASARSSSSSLHSFVTMPASRVASQALRPLKSTSVRLSRVLSGPWDMPGATSVTSEAPAVAADSANEGSPPPVRPSLLTIPKPDAQDDSSVDSRSTNPSLLTTSTLTSCTTINSNSSRLSLVDPILSKKLKKRRPASQPPKGRTPMVSEGADAISYDIPPIPSHIASRHASRKAEDLSITQEEPRSNHSNMTRRSSSPELPAPSHLRYPAIAGSVSETALDTEQDDFASIRSAAYPRFGFSKRLSAFIGLINERKVSGQSMDSQVDVTNTIADFGTVAQSLGSSPYDAAVSKDSWNARRRSSPNLTHPHQMTTAAANPLSRSMTADDATHLARQKSQPRNKSVPCQRPAISETSALPKRDKEQSHAPSVRQLKELILSPTDRQSSKDSLRLPRRLQRPKSLQVDIPPVPALPSPAEMLQREVELSRSRHPSTGHTSARSVQFSTSPLDADSLSIFSKLPASTELLTETVSPASVWDTQKSLWSERRKSAGESLLRKVHTLPISTSQEFIPRPSSVPKSPASSTLSPKSITPPPRRLPPPPPTPPTYQEEGDNYLKPIRSYHIPMGNRGPSPRPMSHHGSTNAIRNSPFDAQGHRMSGRYEGGYGFGYEPGFGLGGSAGTRSTKTGASRKSVDVSMGFGIDLSDVPIFVAPNSG
ncbi:hypothetical protein MMC25_000136 [Agyrium rufum]|nr:hypothetical protein [Agyrium rufum]